MARDLGRRRAARQKPVSLPNAEREEDGGLYVYYVLSGLRYIIKALILAWPWWASNVATSAPNLNGHQGIHCMLECRGAASDPFCIWRFWVGELRPSALDCMFPSPRTVLVHLYCNRCRSYFPPFWLIPAVSLARRFSQSETCSSHGWGPAVSAVNILHECV